MKPILVLNIAWMRDYRGVTGDTPEGTFRFMREGGTPHEVLNFLPTHGRYYGYAPVHSGTINIARLGASPDDDFIDNVLVVWTARRPGGGRVIVGWYDGARVFATYQERSETAETRAVGSPLYYIVAARTAACRLLKLDERVFLIPQGQKGFPGQAASFFPEDIAPKGWVESVRRYIGKGKIEPVAAKKPKDGRSVDPEHRAKVEVSAIRRVTEHYQQLGYTVSSFEADNLGWDLEAQQGRATLRLEVKGLSGDVAVVEVTPNEYKAMVLHDPSYRLCIVTDALAAKRARLRIFAYDVDAKAWLSDDLDTLKIAEQLAARISVSVPLRAL
jgi:hypothetical protein